MPSTLTETILTQFDPDAEKLLVVDPSESVLSALISARFDSNHLPELAVVATEPRLKSALSKFPTAAKAAALVDETALTLRRSDAVAGNSLLLTTETAAAIVDSSDGIIPLPATEQAVVDKLHTTYQNRFENAEPYSLRTPSLTQLQTTLEDTFGTAFRTDFEAVIEALESYAEPLEIVPIVLLLAAKHEALLYDISNWGEETGLASKATFSRTKTELEDQELIGTAKVPIEVGRPRLRLQLIEDDLMDEDVPELVDTAIKTMH